MSNVHARLSSGPFSRVAVLVITFAVLIAGRAANLAAQARDNFLNSQVARQWLTESPAAWLDRPGIHDCQQLWASRIVAVTDIQAAEARLQEALGCERLHLIASWAGNLAWSLGRFEAANGWWEQLPSDYLIEWSYRLVLDGQPDKAAYLLNMLLTAPHDDLRPDQQREAFIKLGHVFRTTAQWQNAAAAYGSAWALGEDAELAFYLGMSYREAGEPNNALSVLEAKADKLNIARSYFVADYFIQLGLAYREAHQPNQAIAALQEAYQWAEREGNTDKLEFVQSLLRPLDSQSGEMPGQEN